MRILVTGLVLFVIWCFISAWLYNDKLLPLMNKPIATQPISEPQDNKADSLIKLKASMPANLTIYFEFNGTKFKPDQQTDNSLIPFKAWLEKYPGSLLSLIGYTDIVGTAEYNYELGLKRAKVVEKYIENQGINTSRMVVESKGKTEATSDYITEEGRARNRKTIISIKMQ